MKKYHVAKGLSGWTIVDTETPEESRTCDLCGQEAKPGEPVCYIGEEVGCYHCVTDFDRGMTPEEKLAQTIASEKAGEDLPLDKVDIEAELNHIARDYVDCDCPDCIKLGRIAYECDKALAMAVHQMEGVMESEEGSHDHDMIWVVLNEMVTLVKNMTHVRSSNLTYCCLAAATIQSAFQAKAQRGIVRDAMAEMMAKGSQLGLLGSPRVDSGILSGSGGKLVSMDASPEMLRALPPEMREQIKKDFIAAGRDLPEGLDDDDEGSGKGSRNVH